jgi:hypothetical protein
MQYRQNLANNQRLFVSTVVLEAFSLLSTFPSCLCVLPYQLLNASTNLYETWHVYHGTWAHFNGVLHKSLPSVCVSIPLSLLGNGSVNTFPRQRIHATELLDASFPMRSVSIEGESVRLCIPLLLLANRSVNTFPPQKKNCWRRGFLCGPCHIKGK